MSHAQAIKVKQVKVTLDKERTIKFDLNSFIELEDVYGSVQKALEEIQKGSIKAVRTVLWAGLVHEDEKLTPKQVGAMIDMNNLPQITEALVQAIGDSLPVKENTGEPDVTGDTLSNP